MTDRLIRLVTLWVHPGQEAAFEAFEREAARIMARHGGRIDQAVRLAQPEGGRAGEAPFEVHVVSFPDKGAFEAYGADSETVALRSRRDQIISRTVMVEGWSAGPY
jgi:uncharacterized protein (DUF1330 family)